MKYQGWSVANKLHFWILPLWNSFLLKIKVICRSCSWNWAMFHDALALSGKSQPRHQRAGSPLHLQTAWQVMHPLSGCPPSSGKLTKNKSELCHPRAPCIDRRQSSLTVLSLLSVILKSIAQPDAQNNGCGLSSRTWPIWSLQKTTLLVSYWSGRSMLLHRGDLHLSTWPCYWGNLFQKSDLSE